MDYLVANRAYQSDHSSFRVRGDVDELFAFRAYAFLSGVNLLDPNGLAATVAVEFYFGRFVGYEPDAVALGAVYLPAGKLVADVDFLAA